MKAPSALCLLRSRASVSNKAPVNVQFMGQESVWARCDPLGQTWPAGPDLAQRADSGPRANFGPRASPGPKVVPGPRARADPHQAIPAQYSANEVGHKGQRLKPELCERVENKLVDQVRQHDESEKRTPPRLSPGTSANKVQATQLHAGSPAPEADANELRELDQASGDFRTFFRKSKQAPKWVQAQEEHEMINKDACPAPEDAR